MLRGPASPACCARPEGSARSSRRSCSTSSPPPWSPTSCARQPCSEEGSNTLGTKEIPEGSRIPGFTIGDTANTEIYGFIFIAVAAGFAYWFVLNKTRFGFNLRATGQSTTAAVASGISVKRMTIGAMLISGGVAGLVGLPILFGDSYSYGSTFQSGLGFAGIAIALLGRNHPIGIALGALLFAFLDEQSNPLQILVGVSPDIVAITQGVIVLTVVISYEVVRRVGVRLEQQQVARALDVRRIP